jgi:hypothetical protein
VDQLERVIPDHKELLDHKDLQDQQEWESEEYKDQQARKA